MTLKISSRNCLEGTIRHLDRHATHTEVTIELPGGQEIVSVVTNASAHRLGLSEGMTVEAIIPANSVVLAVE
ncbi:MAG: TOBE domain-containing protein [Pirellulales bacterium]|nr:TOBE domain-containing protein [Pirellulales bacterium]